MYKSPGHTDDEWLEIITECRRSGLSDAAWCRQHDISKSTFYNAAVRLRKKACKLPERSGEIVAVDLTVPKEPVVIHVIDQPDAPISAPARPAAAVPHLDNSHMIEITIGPATIKAASGSDPDLLQSAILAVGRLNYAG